MPTYMLHYSDKLKKYLRIYMADNKIQNINQAIIDSLETLYGLKEYSKTMLDKDGKPILEPTTPQNLTIASKGDIDDLLTKTLPSLNFVYKEALSEKLAAKGTFVVRLENFRIRIL